MATKTLDETLQGMQQHIKPLDINDMSGRMLKIPSKKSKNHILLIYGHHSSLERMYGVAELLSDYGSVTMPDLPGFGGMDSFHSIGMKPTLDSMADYLASFIKLRYRGKKVTIIGMSLGFVIATRMLQRYPGLTDKVNMMISLVGFSHRFDFRLSKKRQFFYLLGSRLFKMRLPAAFFYNVILHPTVIRTFYARTHNAKNKFVDMDAETAKAITEYEVALWRMNDVRTYMAMTTEFLTLDNCKKSIDLPLDHISVDQDRYFDHNVVEQHLRVIFRDVTTHVASLGNHAPVLLASKKDATKLLPASVKKLLKKLP